MKPKGVYLTLALVGIFVPYLHFLPWLREHGLDLPLFFHSIHANHVSEFFAADVMTSALVVIAFVVYERRRLQMVLVDSVTRSFHRRRLASPARATVPSRDRPAQTRRACDARTIDSRT